jgi:hypothetical protein
MYHGIRNPETMPVPLFHMDTGGVVCPVPFASFFFAGYRRSCDELCSRFFCIAPQADRIFFSFVVHDYQSLDMNMKTGMAAGESVSENKEPGIISTVGQGMARPPAQL